MLKTPLKLAVKIVMQKILEQNYDSILRVVYNAPGRPLYPNYYESTTEFLNAWDIAVHSSKAIKGHDIEGSFFYKPSEMESIAPCEENHYMGQHHGIGTNISRNMDNPTFGVYGSGSTVRPSNLISKCRCNCAPTPVLPIIPITAPASTAQPTGFPFSFKCWYSVCTFFPSIMP